MGDTADMCGPMSTHGSVRNESQKSDESESESKEGAAKISGKKKCKAGRKRTMCTAYSRTSDDLLQRVIESLPGWEPQFLKKTGCDVYWVASSNDFDEVVKQLKPRQRINRFPGMTEACHKVVFAKLLQRTALVHDEAVSFWPQTWTLPEDMAALRKAMATKATFIVKPDTASQGDGIFLCQSFDALECKLRTSSNARDLVIQRYINNPLLLDGLKFDLRLYVLVKSVAPLEVFICKEGLARFCTEKYEPASQKNFHKVMGHLTNYSLNKRSDKFSHSDEDGDTGTKRFLSTTFQRLHEAGLDTAVLWEQIATIVKTTMVALAPMLVDEFGAMFGPDAAPQQCFQVLGFDVMMDSKGKPYLLEVNSHPSFQLTTVVEGDDCTCMDFAGPHSHEICPVDEKVKVMAVSRAIQICTSAALEAATVGEDPDDP